MATEQIAAAFIGALLLALSIAALVRSRSVYVVVALALLTLIPIVGFLAYSLVPRPVTDLGTFVDVAFVPALVALAAGTFAVSGAMNRGQSLTAARLKALGFAYVVLWVGIVLAISGLLAVWEPAYAIANLVLNAAWICFWAVPRTRSMSRTSAIEIRAPRERVFAFMTDAANWPSYDEHMVSATAAPPGPLRVGSRVTAVVRYDSPVRGPRMLPTTVEVVSVVTAITPSASMSARDARAVVTTTTSFSDAGDGTKVSIDVRIAFPFHQAFLGGVVLFRAQREARRARAERNLARLKELLETAPGQ